MSLITEPHWTSYVAIVTGIIGALTGIAGSLMGYIAYRRSNEINKSDRRTALKELRNGVHSAAKELLDLLPKALRSRKFALNARGLLNSSITIRYTDKHTNDLKRAEELLGQIPPEDTNYDSMNLQQLEQERVRLDRIKIEIEKLLAEYQDSMQHDKRESERIRKQRS